MRSAIEYPTIRLVQASLIAHSYSLASVVGCSVMSVSHNRSGAGAVHRRATRSSWTGGPGVRCRPGLRAWRPDQALLGAQPVDAVAAGGDPQAGELVGDEPVAELGVVVVDVDRGVDEVGVVPVALADGIGAPLVEGLLGEPEHPAGHRDRDLVGGQVCDQREHHVGRVSRAK